MIGEIIVKRFVSRMMLSFSPDNYYTFYNNNVDILDYIKKYPEQFGFARTYFAESGIAKSVLKRHLKKKLIRNILQKDRKFKDYRAILENPEMFQWLFDQTNLIKNNYMS